MLDYILIRTFGAVSMGFNLQEPMLKQAADMTLYTYNCVRDPVDT